MSSTPESEAFYEKLKSQLLDTAVWPSIYLYKFIITTDASKVEQIEKVFDNMGAVITTKKSKNAKYTSVSIKVMMKDPDAVVVKYKEVGDMVPGVMSL